MNQHKAFRPDLHIFVALYKSIATSRLLKFMALTNGGYNICQGGGKKKKKTGACIRVLFFFSCNLDETLK